MSTDSDSIFNSDQFKTNGQWTHQGSTNAGTWTGSTGQPLHQQGSTESAASFQAREAAHNWAANQNNNN